MIRSPAAAGSGDGKGQAMGGDDTHRPDAAPAGEDPVGGRLDGLGPAPGRRPPDGELGRRLARIVWRRPDLIDRLSWVLHRRRLRAQWRRRRRSDVKALRRLDRDLRNAPTAVPAVTTVPSIDQIAADLRRLDRQRHARPTTHSERWVAAVVRAYDQRLVLACRILGLAEHLDGLDGIDRDIERVRIEAVLHESGVEVRTR
jgi:hypothetical protein